MSLSAHLAAQAKINLFLHVGPRAPDGYHAIETAFLRIDLADHVLVREASGRSLDLSGPALPDDGLGPTERNLAFRAATAYADVTGWPSGFAIELVKRIPAGAGLGGGSADAGAVLRALEALSPRPLGARLVDVAATLGADVPFMSIDEPMALGAGRGEILKPIPALEPRSVVIAVPPFPISTTDAYAWLDADRAATAPASTKPVAQSLLNWDEIARSADNDFEPVVSRRHPRIATILNRLRSAGAAVALLAGSGSSVFGAFDVAPAFGAIGLDSDTRVIATWTSDRVERVTVEQ